MCPENGLIIRNFLAFGKVFSEKERWRTAIVFKKTCCAPLSEQIDEKFLA